MTEDERAQRIHAIVYSCDSRTEIAERMVETEDENAKLRELVRDIDEVADPYTWEFIGRRKAELGIEVDG